MGSAPPTSSPLLAEPPLSPTLHLPDDPFAGPLHSSTLRHSRAQPASLPPSPAPLSNAPLFVIRAVCSYRSDAPNLLSFKEGDFFHVTNVETDDEGATWYVAEDPLRCLQGKTRSVFFKKFAALRPTRCLPCPPSPGLHEDSSSSTSSTIIASVSPNGSTNGLHSTGPEPRHLVLPPKLTTPSMLDSLHRSLYGTVRHKFVAERSDELSANQGEHVIVIAQSANEWFVIKPIGRLGGPGLIPVSYVDVEDVRTGRVLTDEEVLLLFRRSAVPNVEEWKRAVAAYRGSAVTLGELTISNLVPLSTSPTPDGATPLASIPRITPDDALPCDQKAQANQAKSDLVAEWQVRQTRFEQVRTPGPYGLETVEEEPEDGSSGLLSQRYGSLKTAVVCSFHYEQDQYWFEVRAHFQSSGGQPIQLLLYRRYEDFTELASGLEHEFPEDVESLPELDQSPQFEPIDTLACAVLVEKFNNYLKSICELPEHVRTSDSMFQFLHRREGDIKSSGRDDPQKKPEQELKSVVDPSEEVDLSRLSLSLPAQSLVLEGLLKPLTQSGGSRVDDDKSWTTSTSSCKRHSKGGFQMEDSINENLNSTAPSSLNSPASILTFHSSVQNLECDQL